MCKGKCGAAWMWCVEEGEGEFLFSLWTNPYNILLICKTRDRWFLPVLPCHCKRRRCIISFELIMEVIDRLLITFQNSSTWYRTAAAKNHEESFQYQVQDGFHSQDDNTFFAPPSNWNIKWVGMLNMVSPKRYVTKIFSVSGWLPLCSDVCLRWSGVATIPSRKWI